MAATMRYSRNYLVVINHEPSRARFIKRGGYICNGTINTGLRDAILDYKPSATCWLGGLYKSG
jgi:hypothetical protein